MPTTEELIQQVADLRNQIDPLLADSAELKAMKAKPNFGGVHRGSDEGIVGSDGYWLDGYDSLTIVEGRDDLIHTPTLKRKTGNGVNLKALSRETGYQPYSEFKSFGDFVRWSFLEAGGDKNKIEPRVQKHMEPILKHLEKMKAIQGGNTRDGDSYGYTVMPEFSMKILERLFDNNLWGMTDQYVTSGNAMTFLASAETSRANGSRAGGMLGYWVPEGETITKSKPTMREINVKLGKIAIVVYLTDEILADTSIALEQRIVKQAAAEFKFLQADALFNGVGTGGIPLGLMNSPHLVTVSAEAGQIAATLNAYNVENMHARMFAPMRDGARWFIHQDTEPQLQTMTVGMGLGQVPIYYPQGGISAAPYATLKGKPVQPTEFNATLGTTGDIILANLGQYLTISKGGIEQAVSMHVEFLTDQMALRFTLRCGGRPWENAPLTPFKGSNTQSSAIALATR